MKPRHGAASTLVLTAAGLIGLGLAGLSAVTGVTPCSLMSGSCATTAAETASATPVAATSSASDKGETEAALVSDSQESCDKPAEAAAASADCATKSDCGDKAKAATVAASSDCDAAKTCEGESVQLVAGSSENCSEKTACEDAARAVTVAADGDCQKTCDDAAKAQTVAASNEGEACGGECAEGDVKALPVAIHAFNDNCPYSGNPAKADVVADYHGMKVNFCCNGCKTRFDKADDAKRLELVSGVVKPINSECCDKPVKAETMAVVQGFPVAFCKSACGEMVKNADAEKQMAFVSSKIKPVNESCCNKPAGEAKMVAFHDGQALALCGETCAEHYNEATDEQKSAHIAKLVANKKDGKTCGEDCTKSCCIDA